jgi:hypothetical protein
MVALVTMMVWSGPRITRKSFEGSTIRAGSSFGKQVSASCRTH